MPLFYANALIDTENAFLKFLKTHVDMTTYENALKKYTKTHKVKV